ncbi:MAG: SAM-dependent methyltransferase [Candidatus Nealsonbacteria bacterium]
MPIARKKLKPLGIKVVQVDKSGKLPFTNQEFNLVLNRHSSYNTQEVFRVLKKDGVFLTQQVGGDNLEDLRKEFNVGSKFKNWKLEKTKRDLKGVGFKIEQAESWSGKIEFKDVGALVHCLKAIPWIVENFSVDNYLPILESLQKRIDEGKKLIFTETKFLIQAKK